MEPMRCDIGERPQLPQLTWASCGPSCFYLDKPDFLDWLEYASSEIAWHQMYEQLCEKLTQTEKEIDNG